MNETGALLVGIVTLLCDKPTERKTYRREALALVHEARGSYRNQRESLV